MGLFNFNKNKKQDTVKIEEQVIKHDVSQIVNQECKKYNLICINFGVNDYSFTLTVNSNGKIVINKSMGKEEYEDYDKADEIAFFIDENLDKIKELSALENVISHEDNNMLQFEISGEKYTLFRNSLEDELTMFYDRFIFEIAEILNLKKNYENIELDFTFDYPNNWDKVPADLTKYCLLSNSVPILVFKDGNQNFITFESINLRNDIVSKIISNMSSSEDYKILKTFNFNKEDYNAKFILVDYILNNKIELFCLLSLKNICVIITAVIDEKDNVDISKIESNKKFKEILAVIDSFKILTAENINQ